MVLGKVQNELTAAAKKTLVVRLLSGDLGYTGLVTGIRTVLKPKGEYHIMDLQNRFFLLKFELKSDYNHVLLNGPWMIRGSYLTVQPWSPEFCTKKILPARLAAWVSLPGLPFHLL